VKTSRLIFIWHVYAATYIAIFLLLTYCAIIALLPTVLADHVGLFSESTWGHVILLILLFLSLLINYVIAFFMMPIMDKRLCKPKESPVVDN
jgi:hypothetical protein